MSGRTLLQKVIQLSVNVAKISHPVPDFFACSGQHCSVVCTITISAWLAVTCIYFIAAFMIQSVTTLSHPPF